MYAKNSAKNLSKFLPNILSQDYPKFEVILIENESADDTIEIIESYAKKNEHIKIVKVENNEAFWGSKKYAITLGIKSAQYDHLLFTGVDCSPNSKNWIYEMSKHFTKEKSIILGYSNLSCQKSIRNLLIRFYNLIISLQYLNFAKIGIPFMADGKNLAYKKTTFYRTKGYVKHLKYEFGEDDLFIQEAANHNNTTYTISKDSFVKSANFESFSSWFAIQQRKVLLKRKYQFSHRFLIALFSISKIFFYGLAIFFLTTNPTQLLYIFIAIFYVVQFTTIGIAQKKLEEKNLIYFVPILDICFLLIQMSIFMANFSSKSIR